jgi:hypothetical protein
MVDSPIRAIEVERASGTNSIELFGITIGKVTDRLEVVLTAQKSFLNFKIENKMVNS